MTKEELLNYEMPTYAEYISWDWLQNIIAKRLARKINRKIKRYNTRVERIKYLKSKGFFDELMK